MNDNSDLADLYDIKLEDKGMYQIPSKTPLLRRLELNLSTPSRPFNDMVNCIAADSSDCRILAMGTEKGLVYVFNFDRNRMMAFIKAEHWIGALLVNSRKVLVSTFAFCISEYSLRSGFLTNRISPTTKEREGFGPKGVIFSEIKERELIIFNSGYLAFKIYSIPKKKVLRVFNLSSSTHQRMEDQQGMGKMVKNFGFNTSQAVLTIILKDDPHLYLWDLVRHKTAGTIKMYNSEQLPRGMVLVNSGLINSRHHCFVLLQFMNQLHTSKKIKSVLIVIEISGNHSHKKGKVVLYDKLGMLRSPEYGIDLFLSQVVSHCQNFTSEVVNGGGNLDGYLMVIGTRNGYSLIVMVDLILREVRHYAYYRKIEGRGRSKRRRSHGDGCF